MKKCGFEGWYFKHQKGENVVAFIPGRADSEAFVQMISSGGSRQFSVPNLAVRHGIIYAGRCRFSRRGCQIHLPGIQGKLTYGPLTPLASDIMGPFRFFPMECRHGVISMTHTVAGRLSIDGQSYCFDKGKGYIEKDSGTSFPSSYQWLQCNHFSEPCSIMVSIAQIPFYGIHFQGCIGAIFYQNREYRLATYRGVRIRAASADHICLTQGKRLLEIDMKPSHEGHPLQSPIRGQMSGMIRESCNASIHARLWERGKLIFDLRSDQAAYEFVPPKRQ